VNVTGLPQAATIPRRDLIRRGHTMNEPEHTEVEPYPKPIALSLSPENIPQNLKALRHWVVWRYEHRKGKWTKPLFNANSGAYASSTDPATWSDYETALATYQKGGVDGIGVALTADLGIVGVDLDHCYNPQTKSFEPWATTIIDHFNSYTEASPSGTGVRIFVKGKLPAGGRKKGNIEIYSTGRYLTLTGRVLKAYQVRTIEARQAEIDAFLAEHFPEPKAENRAGAASNGNGHLSDHEILEIGLRAKNGDKLKDLLSGNCNGYPSASEAEMAFCSLLKFYTQDGVQIDRIYRGSRLFRDKWDEKHYGDGATYGERTIQKAISGATETYSGKAEGGHNSFPSLKEGIGKGTNQNPFLHTKEAVVKESNWHPLSAAEILTLSTPEILWLWQWLIPVGSLFLLCAYMKVGKSTLAYRIALAIAQGLACLDRATTKTGVLILAVEEHIRDVRRRLERFSLTAEMEIYVIADRGQSRDLAKIREFVQAKGIGLILIDSLSRWWDVVDENSNMEVLRAVSPLLDLAHDTSLNVAIGLIVHERKSGGEDGRGIRGGSSLFGLVDQAIILDRRPGETSNKRLLKTLGRYEDSPKEIIIDLVGDDYVVLGTPEQEGHSQAVGKVRDALTAKPGKTIEPMDVKTLAVETGLTQKMVRRALESMGDEIQETGAGVKNDPHNYSLLSQYSPIGKETNPAEARWTSDL
jgi:putative DNA primase/helicase